jgi:hypothetical protein
MSQIAAIIGSSKDLSGTFWRIWQFDLRHETVIPLAEFGGKKQSDNTAFELAQSVASLKNPATAGSKAAPAPGTGAKLHKRSAEASRLDRLARPAKAAHDHAKGGRGKI